MLRFFLHFLRNPRQVGAVAPSSTRLARVITDGIGLEQAAAIVEYGPGTGAFTRTILERKAPGARYVAVEHNPALAAHFRERFPGAALVEGSVADLPEHLPRLGIASVDCIVSGLPWAAFDPALQDRLLGVTREVLRPGGAFATFAYLQGLLLSSGQRFRQRLGDSFATVSRTPTVWLNLPPAFVYRCRR